MIELAKQDRLPNRVHMFGMEVDCLALPEAVATLRQWIAEPGDRCRYVVTPNVDHVVMLDQDPVFRNAYQDAAMIVADGFPIVAASRLLGKALPERVAGSDLVPALLAAADPDRPLRVFLLGAAPGVATRAATRIEATCPGVQIVGTCSPPLGFQHDPRENRAILAQIEAADVDLLVIGLGAPKQELWVHQHCQELRATVAVCAGATIDFLAGEKRRAPRWVQKIGLEWCHRVLSEPRRLLRRYARDAWVFPQLLWKEWADNRN